MGLYALAILMYGLPELLCGAEIPAYAETLVLCGFALVGYLVVVQVLQRLHDLDMSAWWAFVMFLPLVSYVLGAGLQLVQGTRGPNRFGPDPKRPALPATSQSSSELPVILP